MRRLLILVLIMIIAVGCSTGNGPVLPTTSGDVNEGVNLTNTSQTAQNGRYLWGLYEWVIDLEAETCEMIPLRDASAHFNVVRVMNASPPRVSFEGFVVDKPNNTISLDVILNHPYPGMPNLAGFDVHGILIGPGSMGGLNDPTLMVAGPNDPHILNADGWTRWWNPVEFNIGNDLFSYTDGIKGIPYSIGNYNATLNAYKTFSDDLSSIEDLSDINITDRLIFTADAVHSRHYDLWFPVVADKYVLRYNYAIDASWEPIPGYIFGDPVSAPDDWEPGANQPEPFWASAETMQNGLYFESSSVKGGSANLQIKVYDWQGYLNGANVADEISSVKFECPDGYEGIEMGTMTDPGSGGLPYATYEIGLDGEKLLTNQNCIVLLTIESANSNYQPSLTGYSGTAPLSYYRFVGLPTIADKAPMQIDLGAAAPFGGFGGGAGMTNEGIYTVINGDIGTTGESTTMTGFHDSVGDIYTETPLNIGTVTGRIYTAPPSPGGAGVGGTAETFAIATAAAIDALDAWNSLSPASLPGGMDPGDGQLGGLTLAPGIYKAASDTFLLTGSDLTLDGQGDSNAVWVFQTAAGLTIGEPGFPRSVHMINGAQARNVFWYVGSAARIEDCCYMVGTIIASAGVTISTHDQVCLTTLDGRALGLYDSVTMVNTIINIPPE